MPVDLRLQRRQWLVSVVSGATAYLVRSAIGRSAGWPDEYRCGQFLCHADFSLLRHRGFLHTIPGLQHGLTDHLGIEPTQEPIHLFLFERKTTYEAYLREHFPDVPNRKALFIKQRGPGMVFAYRGEDFETDLRHECTHALLNASLPMVPLWLDEGLAEYFEVPAADREHGNPHAKYIKIGAHLGQVPRLEDLEQIRDLSEMTRSRYRAAWAWVHFMLHGPPAVGEELRRYLADIHAMTPPGVLSRRLRSILPDLDTEFGQHCRS
jgi:hypothetical protein